MKTVKILTIAFIALFATACEKKCSETFYKSATAESYSPDFKVYIKGIEDDYIPLKYTYSNPEKMGMSPPNFLERCSRKHHQNAYSCRRCDMHLYVQRLL